MPRVHPHGPAAPAEPWRPLEPVTSSLVGLGTELARLLDHVARRGGSLSFSQYQLLGALRETDPEPREPWELGRALGAGSAQVTALLDQLQRAGLVVREAHERDRRRRLVRLTDEGRRRVEAVALRIRAIEELILARGAGPGRGEELRRRADRLRAVIGEVTASDRSFELLAEPGRAPEQTA